MKKAVRRLFIGMLLTAVLFAGAAVARNMFHVGTVFGWSVFYLTGASMEPAIPPGAALVVRSIDRSSLEIGDVITFYSQEYAGLTTHRVYDIKDNVLKTKGDANDFADRMELDLQNIIGRVEYVVPRLGGAVHRLLSGPAKAMITILAVGIYIVVAFRL